jgi:multidrug resistance efflux pump
MKLNWFYIFIALFFCCMLFISMRYFKGSGHASVGVAYGKQYKVNADKSALVKSVAVVPGQEIKEGHLLVELSSSDLEMTIAKLEHRISVLKSDQSEKNKLAKSEIALVRAESGIKEEELNTDIVEEEGNLRLNREITKTHNLLRDSVTETPGSQRIKALKSQRSRQVEATSIKIQDILQENQTEQKLLDNQIHLLQRELDLLNEEKKKLNKYASAAGVVETVYVKAGEQIDAYTPLLSLNPVHPSTVVGYLVGKKVQLPIGSSVTISSYERPKETSPGKVIGYGSVVELPEILQKSTAVKAFGREVFIEIEDENGFASGEKVLIR